MEISNKLLVEAIANHCITEAEANTDNCSWIIYFDEIVKHFGVTEKWLLEHRGEIKDEIASNSDIIAEVDDEDAEDFEDNAFDLDVYGNYCDVDVNEDDDEDDDEDADDDEKTDDTEEIKQLLLKAVALLDKK
jgi:hypothetical protein